MVEDEIMLQVKIPEDILEAIDAKRQELGISRRVLVLMLLKGYLDGDIRIKAESASLEAQAKAMLGKARRELGLDAD